MTEAKIRESAYGRLEVAAVAAGIAAVVLVLVLSAGGLRLNLNFGHPVVGNRFAFDAGTWTNKPTTFGFLWERCSAYGQRCKGIAVERIYRVSRRDVGHKLALLATACNGIGCASQPLVRSGVVEAGS